MFTKKIINDTENSIRISSVKEATDTYLSTTDGDYGDNTDAADYMNKPDTVAEEDFQRETLSSNVISVCINVLPGRARHAAMPALNN